MAQKSGDVQFTQVPALLAPTLAGALGCSIAVVTSTGVMAQLTAPGAGG